MEEKACTICREVKSLEAFYRATTARDGRCGKCKACICALRRAKYAAMTGAERQAFHAKNAAWARAHPEAMNAIKEKSRVALKDRHNEQSRAYYARNANRLRVYYMDRYRKNPAQWQASHHRYRARKAGNGGEYTVAEWRTLCERFDYRCLCCGERKPLTADHVVPLVKGGTSDISNIQPLCRSCNCKKSKKMIDYRPLFSIVRP